MWIGSLVELYVGLHSCLCFSPLEKLFWKAGSTPPRYLAICRASQAFFLSQSRQVLDTWWIDREYSYLLDSFSTLGVSIELLFLDLIPCCSIPQLSTTIFSILTLIASSIPLDTCIYRDLLRVYIYFLRDPFLISLISLDLYTPVHLPNTLSLSLQTSSFVIFQAFSRFFLSW